MVILALFFSIIESQLILPAHLAHRKPERQPGPGTPLLNRWLALQDKLSSGMQALSSDYYLPAVRRAVEWRYLTLAIALGILLVTAAMLVSGRVVFQFFPSVEGNRLYATLTTPEGTPIEQTEAAVKRIETAAEHLRDELDADLEPGEASRVKHIMALVGSNIPKGSIGDATIKSNIAEIGVELNLPADYDGVSTREFANRWRELTGSIPDAEHQDKGHYRHGADGNIKHGE